jgi:hypothetical protein
MEAQLVTLELTAEERVYVEACLARRRELLALADTAPTGQVLAQCENATVEIARRYAHQLLEDAMARRARGAEKKGPPHGSANVDAACSVAAPTRARS